MPTRMAIKRAIDAEIDARLSVAAGVVEYSSEAPGDPSLFPALNRKAETLVPDHNGEIGTTRYAYLFTVEGNVDGDGGEEAEDARDALYLAMIDKIPSDPEIFGGLVEEFEEGATRFGVATLSARRSLSFVTEFTARFPADRGDPSVTI